MTVETIMKAWQSQTEALIEQRVQALKNDMEARTALRDLDANAGDGAMDKLANAGKAAKLRKDIEVASAFCAEADKEIDSKTHSCFWALADYARANDPAAQAAQAAQKKAVDDIDAAFGGLDPVMELIEAGGKSSARSVGANAKKALRAAAEIFAFAARKPSVEEAEKALMSVIDSVQKALEPLKAQDPYFGSIQKSLDDTRGQFAARREDDVSALQTAVGELQSVVYNLSEHMERSAVDVLNDARKTDRELDVAIATIVPHITLAFARSTQDVLGPALPPPVKVNRPRLIKPAS